MLLPQPSTYELIARALVDTDFLAEIVPCATHHDLATAARVATDQACEAWEADIGLPPGQIVSDPVREAAIVALTRHGSKVVASVESEIETYIADAIGCGELVERAF